MTGNSRPEDFSDFHIYFSKSTKHPLKAMFTTTLPHPITFSQAVSDPQWCTAMENELNALLENGTGLLWPRPLDQNVIRNKWVFKLKQKPDGTIERQKARLVAKGFEQRDGSITQKHLAAQ